MRILVALFILQLSVKPAYVFVLFHEFSNIFCCSEKTIIEKKGKTIALVLIGHF